MDSSFVVYVDESGDEGFVFKSDGSGSSRWFVISAVIVRKKKDHHMVSCLKEVREILKKPVKTPLHFVDLKHEQRIPYIRRVGDLPIRAISVLIHKPSISEPEKFQNNKYLLYRYATRLLLERVSWLCRDTKIEGEGDGFAKIIFSNRSNMSYEEIRNYLKLLLNQSEQDPLLQIDPKVIDPNRISSVEHYKLAGLQIADAVASGIHFAVKINRYQETESAYLQHLRKISYRHKDNAIGYGIKLWPEDLISLKTKAPEVLNFEGF